MKLHILPTLFIATCMAALTPSPYTGLARQQPTQTGQHLYKVVNRHNRTGFIDKAGRLVIGFDRFPTGVEIDDFHEGLASICFRNQDRYSFGYIDQNGGMTIAPRFKIGYGFRESLAYVETEDMKGFIDRDGKVVIRLEENQQLMFGGFHDGRAIILTPQGMGFIDRSGKVVVEPSYSHVRPFSEGLAAVGSGNPWRNMKYGFIDRDGKMVIPARFEARVEDPISFFRIETSRFSEDLARVWVGGLYGYINKKGEFVIPPRFALAGDFSEGLACVVENDKLGYIDKRGRWAILPRFDGNHSQHSIYKPFGNGLAPVAVLTGHNLRWGYVDRKGKLAIPPIFANAFPFKDGVAMVYVLDPPARGMVVRYIDTTGRILWEPK